MRSKDVVGLKVIETKGQKVILYYQFSIASHVHFAFMTS